MTTTYNIDRADLRTILTAAGFRFGRFYAQAKAFKVYNVRVVCKCCDGVIARTHEHFQTHLDAALEYVRRAFPSLEVSIEVPTHSAASLYLKVPPTATAPAPDPKLDGAELLEFMLSHSQLIHLDSDGAYGPPQLKPQKRADGRVEWYAIIGHNWFDSYMFDFIVNKWVQVGDYPVLDLDVYIAKHCSRPLVEALAALLKAPKLSAQLAAEVAP